MIDQKTFDVLCDQTPDGRLFVATFSDRHLAERFAARKGNPDAEPVEVKSKRDWLEYLEALVSDGHQLIDIDAETGRTNRLTFISAVIPVVRRSLEGRGG